MDDSREIKVDDYVTVAVKNAGFLKGSDLTWEGYVREILPAPHGVKGRLLMIEKPGGFDLCGFHEKWCTLAPAPDPAADKRTWEKNARTLLTRLVHQSYGDALDRPLRNLSERERVVFALVKRILNFDDCDDPEEIIWKLQDMVEAIESQLGLVETVS